MAFRGCTLRALVFVILALILASCGPKSRSGGGGSSYYAGTTGGFDLEGTPYIHNGDRRVDEELEKQAPPSPGTDVTRPTLAGRIKEFQISRFNLDGSGQKQIARFGKESFSLKIFFKDVEPIEFTANFKGDGRKLWLEAVSGDLKLQGDLEDSSQRSLGKLTLTHLKTNESATILYKAFRASLKVREDRTNPAKQGSAFQQQLQNLSQDTFAWVHNWSVVRGVSVYLVDVVKITNSNHRRTSNIPSFFSFKGESKRTGSNEVQAQGLDNAGKADVKLVGNSEVAGQRMFEVTVPDETSATQHSFMLDVKADLEEDLPVDPQDEPVVYGKKESDLKPSVVPDHTGPSEGESLSDSGISVSDDAYLNTDLSKRRTARMVRDYDKNIKSPGVKKFIAGFQRSRSDLNNFYKFANPFRRMMEAIASAFDVSPAFAYITVVESSYFTGGRYQIQSHSKTSATGPFQIMNAIGQQLGAKITGRADDERRFFAPSACVGAQYVANLVDMFDDSDSTLAVLGYFQGDAGAAAAIYCSYSGNVSNRAACARKINKSFSGREYANFKKLAKNYNYTYLEMEKMAAIPQHMRDYVSKKLAVYFISNNMAKYGFRVDRNAPKNFPSNGTAFPRAPIKNQKCRNAVSDFTT